MHSFATAFTFDKSQRQFIAQRSSNKSIDDVKVTTMKKTIYNEIEVLTVQDTLAIGIFKKFHVILMKEEMQKKAEAIRVKEEAERLTMEPPSKDVDIFNPDSVRNTDESVELLSGTESGLRSSISKGLKRQVSPKKKQSAKSIVAFKMD